MTSVRHEICRPLVRSRSRVTSCRCPDNGVNILPLLNISLDRDPLTVIADRTRPLHTASQSVETRQSVSDSPSVRRVVPEKPTAAMATQDPHQPLAELSPNTTSPAKASSSNMTSESIKWNRTDALKDENTAQQNQKQTYVSPSDNILSPVTKKLMGIKDKRFGWVIIWLHQRLES